MRLVILLVLFASGLLVGCSSPERRTRDDGGIPALSSGEVSRPEPPAPACPVEPLPAPTCRHVWQQMAMHPWRHVVDGLPMADMCVVSQCPKCGEVRHDCERRRK